MTKLLQVHCIINTFSLAACSQPPHQLPAMSPSPLKHTNLFPAVTRQAMWLDERKKLCVSRKRLQVYNMVTMVQSAANWHNMYTHLDRTHSHTHTLTWTPVKSMWCKAVDYRIWNPKKIFEGRQNRSTREKNNQTACLLIGITYLRKKSNVPDENWTLTLQHWWAHLAKSSPEPLSSIS